MIESTVLNDQAVFDPHDPFSKKPSTGPTTANLNDYSSTSTSSGDEQVYLS